MPANKPVATVSAAGPACLPDTILAARGVAKVRAEEISDLIQSAMPRARVMVRGDDGAHFEAIIVAPDFRGLARLRPLRPRLATYRQHRYGNPGGRIWDTNR